MTGPGSKVRTTKVPVRDLKKVPVNPTVKKKVPVNEQRFTTDDKDFEDLTDPELQSAETKSESDDESRSELERLQKRLAELESEKATHEPKKKSEVAQTSTSASHYELSPPVKPMNPVGGEMLGTFNGKTDLDTFLIHFKTCSQNFKWSETERVFYLMSSLTESAESLGKEVGFEETLEDIMKLLKSRFGNRCNLEKFRTELKNRKRISGESLQDFFLDLCRLRANAYDNDPKKYIFEIFSWTHMEIDN